MALDKDFKVKNGLVVVSTASILSNSQSISTNSGALQVVGGAGIGSNLYVGGTIYGNLNGGITGNAATASKWLTPRTITLGGDLTGNVSIDGSTNVTLTATIAADSVLLGTDTTGVYIASGATSGFGISGSANTEGSTFTITSNATSSNVSSTLVFRDSSGNFRTNAINIDSTTSATSTNTGALQVVGGAGVGGNLYVGGSLTVIGGISATITGVTTTATNISGGTTGQIPYQTASGATSFYGPGTAGQLLISNGTSAPSYTNTGNISVGFATSSTNISGGTTGQVPYQTASGATSFYGPGTAGQILLSNGTSAPSYTNTGNISVGFATSSTNISGGAAGGIPYQSNTGITTFLPIGSGSFVLTVNPGGTAPQWTSQSNISAGAVYNALTIGSGLSGTTSTYNGSTPVTVSLNTATLIGSAVTATNLSGGLAGQIPYQSAPNTTGFVGPGTSGQILLSQGTSAPIYYSTSSLVVGFSSNVMAGTAGQLVYQSAPNTTGFVGPGSYGQLLMSTGASAPTYQSTLTLSGSNVIINGTTLATSTNSGALQVVGGVGIGGALYASNTSYIAGAQILTTATVNSFVTAGVSSITAGTDTQVSTTTGAVSIWNTSNLQSITSRGATTNQAISITNTTAATSTNSGALQVVGGVGIGGNLYVGSNLNVLGTVNATITGVITTATNIAAGTAGQLHYQSAVGVTSFVGPGTAGQILLSQGTSAPVYYSTGSLVVGYSSNVMAGTAGQLHYQIGPNTTGFVGPGTAGQILLSQGTSAPVYTNTSSILVGSASNLAGGTSGSIAYQSGIGITTFLSIGTNGFVLTSTGSAPSWTALSGLSAGTATTATNIAGGTAGQIPYQSAIGITSFITTGTTGQILLSQGVSAPIYYSTGSLVVGYSNNLMGGSAGQFAYQIAANTTAFISTGSMYVNRSTIADSLANSVTFNNANSGAASGSTFNGSSALTVSANTLGALSLSSGGTVSGAVTFTGPVTFSGSATYALSTNTYYTDNILELHTPPSGVNALWASDDGKDIGLRFHYYVNSTDTNAALVLDATSKYLDWYSSGAESSVGDFSSATYGVFRTGAIVLTSSTQATSTSTGALTVVGGMGVGGALYVGGNLTVSGTINASVTGVITTATNLANGTTGQIPYQSGIGVTSFIGPGTAGQLLLSNGANAPVYYSTGSLVVGFSSNVMAGTAGQLVYQSAPNTTGFVGPGTAGQILLSQGTSAPVYTNTSSILVGSASNLAGGAANQIPFQSSTGNTTFSSNLTYNSATQTLGLTGSFTTFILSRSGNVSANAWTTTSPVFSSAAALLTDATSAASSVIAIRVGHSLSSPNFAATNAITITDAVNLYVNSPVANTNVTITNNWGLYNASNQYVAGSEVVNGILYALSTTAATNTSSGSLQVRGGVGIAGALFVGGNITASSFIGTTTNATTATNISGGTAGQLPYQIGPGSTGFVGPGTAGNVLVSNGTSAPTYNNTLTLAGTTAATSTNSGALQVVGGAGIGGSLYAGGTVVIGDTAIQQNLVIRGGGSTQEGGQIVLGFGNNLASSITGQANNSWNIDVGGGTYDTFRIFRQNSTGSTKVGLQIDNTTGGTQIDSLGVGSTASGTAGEIRATNEITAYFTSDFFLKENLKLIDNPITIINQLNGYYFDWKDEYIKKRGGEDGFFVRKNDVGVIAQEVEKVLPQVVATRTDGTKALRYEKLVPLLIEAIKHQQTQIDQLRLQINSLLDKLK